MRYERVRKLGEGATATSYLCHDRERGGHPVALKLFRRDWSEENGDWIDQEFRILASLCHPHIAAIEDFGEEDGQAFLVSEYVDGGRLLDETGGDLNKTLWLFLQLLQALDYLYFRNVVHLDLKPENILVNRPGASHGLRLKLIDFGLSAPLSLGKGSSSGALGTPPYTAPEFALRRGVDTRSDLYSVGVLLYTALAGEPPFSARDPVSILNRQLSEEASPLKSVSKPLSDFVLTLLRRDPKKRFASPRLARAALQEAMGEEFPLPAIAPPPLFDDSDLLFHPAVFEGLLKKISEEGGLWIIQGEAGRGKTFLARWLERRCWELRRPVVLLDGSKIALVGGGSRERPEETLFIVDDADLGPVAAWTKALKPRHAVFLVRSPDAFSGSSAATGLKREILPLLTEDEKADLLRRVFGGSVPAALQEWGKKVGDNPHQWVLQGRELLRSGALSRKKDQWVYDPSREGTGPSETRREKIRRILSQTRVSLDPETLAGIVGLSVQEAEEELESLAKEGEAERTIGFGRIRFRSLEASTSAPLLEEKETAPQKILKLLDELYHTGRYSEGLELLERIGDISEGAAFRLERARHLGGAGFHERSIEILSDDFISQLQSGEKSVAWETRGKARLFSGRMEEAREDFERAMENFYAEKESDGLSRVLLHLGILEQRLSRFHGALDFYERALNEAEQARRSDLLKGAVLLNLANLHYDASRWDEAEPLYEQAIFALKATGHGAIRAQAFLNAATFSFYQGRLLEAAHRAREALRTAIDHCYPLTQGRVLLLLAMLDERFSHSERQGERLGEALALFREAGNLFEETVGLIHYAYFFETAGDLAAGEDSARKAIALAESMGAEDLAAQARLIMGKILGKKGEKEQGRVMIAEALSHFIKQGNRQLLWECEFEGGELEREAGDIRKAALHYERALRELDQATDGMPPIVRESFLRDGKREKIFKALSNAR